jgi:hypothetical protein
MFVWIATYWYLVVDYVMSFTSRRYRHIKLTKYAHWNQYQQQGVLELHLF